MKYIKIYISGIIIIMIIQFGVLEFLEKVYFSSDVAYSSTLVENSGIEKVANQRLILERNAENTAASYDGEYLSYIKNDDLFILNLDKGEKTRISPDDGMEIMNYKWVYDRNRLILAEGPVDFKKGAFLKLYYYDVEEKNKVEIFNQVDNKNMKIPLYSSSDRVSAIEISTLTNVIYVKISGLNDFSRIYRINIMAQKNSVHTVTNYIGKIFSTKVDDILLYENLKNKRVYSDISKSPITIEGHKEFKLLGVDNDDNVYLASTEGNMAQEIYFGHIADNNWKKVDVTTPADINDIFISSTGKIYIFDSSKSIINEFSTGFETYYKGRIIGVCDNGVISEENNRINKKMFE